MDNPHLPMLELTLGLLQSSARFEEYIAQFIALRRYTRADRANGTVSVAGSGSIADTTNMLAEDVRTVWDTQDKVITVQKAESLLLTRMVFKPITSGKGAHEMLLSAVAVQSLRFTVILDSTGLHDWISTAGWCARDPMPEGLLHGWHVSIHALANTGCGCAACMEDGAVQYSMLQAGGNARVTALCVGFPNQLPDMAHGYCINSNLGPLKNYSYGDFGSLDFGEMVGLVDANVLADVQAVNATAGGMPTILASSEFGDHRNAPASPFMMQPAKATKQGMGNAAAAARRSSSAGGAGGANAERHLAALAPRLTVQLCQLCSANPREHSATMRGGGVNTAPPRGSAGNTVTRSSLAVLRLFLSNVAAFATALPVSDALMSAAITDAARGANTWAASRNADYEEFGSTVSVEARAIVTSEANRQLENVQRQIHDALSAKNSFEFPEAIVEAACEALGRFMQTTAMPAEVSDDGARSRGAARARRTCSRRCARVARARGRDPR